MTHVVITIFTDIVEVLSRLVFLKLGFAIEFVRYVYLLHVCTGFCQLWGLLIQGSSMCEPSVN